MIVDFCTAQYKARWERSTKNSIPVDKKSLGRHKSGARPEHKTGLDEPLELLASGAPLDRNALQHRFQDSSALRYPHELEIALGFRAFEALDESIVDALPRSSTSLRTDLASDPQATDVITPMQPWGSLVLTRILYGPAKHRLRHLARSGLRESLPDVGHLLALIEIERLAEERLLVSERQVEAGPSDPHRLGEVIKRCAFEALFPEHAKRSARA